jgi:glycosyltransferase involved in cell wall biosynthesis
MDLMASSPTITLALIAKNEEKNINRLLDSVEGCFDEIVLVDTGSGDKTKEIAEARGCKVYDFEWVNSFCKARNFAFSKATSEYIMWLDLDDVLHNREGFIQWKNSAMQFSDCFLATYNYALDKDGKPICSFVRERVFKRSINPTWQYDLHEGIIIKPEWSKDYVVTWAVNHLRDADDIRADKSRNIKILENMKGKFDGRLQFYFGKELYEAQRPREALEEFRKAFQRNDVEHHDRILTCQYAAYSAMACADEIKDELKDQKEKFLSEAVRFAHEGLQLEPNRAEMHCILGDVALKRQNLVAAIPAYAAAKSCIDPKSFGSPYEGAIYSFSDCYNETPRLQLAKINFHLGRIDEAEKEAEECVAKYGSEDGKQVLAEIKRVRPLVTLENNQEETDDIVFTCPPVTAYPFDEEIYKTKPLGGSETALVQVAREIKAITGRKVIVFNMRDEDLIADSGVEYLSVKKTNEYFSRFRPKVHIAWRHNIELTKAKTYLWCHDLVTPTVEAKRNFHKILCLSEFHKQYVMGKQGVPAEKIQLTRNGIDPQKFLFDRPVKNPNKLIFMSSPDRGLDRAMLVCDEVRKDFPEAELHVYYGLENLYKYGLADLAEKLKAMMAERPWVKYHGFTEQSKMYRDVADASVWVHPCNFIETFCITALEMLALGVFPVTRRLGALANTLAEAEQKREAILLDHDCSNPDEIKAYANAVCRAILNKQWKNVSLDLNAHSWHSVAREWAGFMEL